MTQPSATDLLAEEIAVRVAAKLGQQPGAKRLLDVRGAAEYLGCSAASVRNRVAAGELKAVRIDRHFRFDMRDLDALIDESKA